MFSPSKFATMFVAINYISCNHEYRERFEYLFSTRAHAIDTLPGFIKMYVLKPNKEDDQYLIVSHWKSENDFHNWTKSPAFIEGHKRGFEDIAKARAEGKPSPMTSDFKTYHILTN